MVLVLSLRVSTVLEETRLRFICKGQAMPVHARLIRDSWGGRDWILHDDGIRHPLVVMTDFEMSALLLEIEEQRQRVNEGEKQARRKKR